jgi:hypothetical protein
MAVSATRDQVRGCKFCAASIGGRNKPVTIAE